MVERLLVPVEGGTIDEHAFAASIDLARQLGASITGFIVEPFADPAAPRTDAALQAHAQGVLSRFEQLAHEAGVAFRGVATQSSEVSGAILEAAQVHGCDMIVMATHGHGLVRELLRGSHTRQVVSRTRLAVVVVH